VIFLLAAVTAVPAMAPLFVLDQRGRLEDGGGDEGRAATAR